MRRCGAPPKSSGACILKCWGTAKPLASNHCEKCSCVAFDRWRLSCWEPSAACSYCVRECCKFVTRSRNREKTGDRDPLGNRRGTPSHCSSTVDGKHCFVAYRRRDRLGDRLLRYSCNP